MTDPIRSATLIDGDTSITVLSAGCAIQKWTVGGRPVALGYDNIEYYRENPCVMGSIVGRVANRISDAKFELNGQVWTLPTNDFPNSIHGGTGGLGWRNWGLEQLSDQEVVLRLHSTHLDQGYPGAVDFEVRLTLHDSALTWEMRAVPDRETPINLAQHVYFNLSGKGDVLDHTLQLKASRMTPTDAALIPTGDIVDVAGTRFDFQSPASIRDNDPDLAGYDINFILDETQGPQAVVTEPDGMRLRLWTDRPGLQIYSSGNLSQQGTPSPGGAHGPHGGLCLEAQDFPNAINQDGFGSILYTPERPYEQRTTIEIAPQSRG